MLEVLEVLEEVEEVEEAKEEKRRGLDFLLPSLPLSSLPLSLSSTTCTVLLSVVLVPSFFFFLSPPMLDFDDEVDDGGLAITFCSMRLKSVCVQESLTKGGGRG